MNFLKFLGRKFSCLTIFLLPMFFPTLNFAQNGTLRGTVVDADSRETLVGTTVMIQGTTIGTITDFDGNYVIPKLAPGEYQVQVSFVSYNTQMLKVSIVSGQETVVNVDLKPASLDIGEVKVVAKAVRETESMLLVDQKDATVIRESIGARQLSIQGVSDASGAASKISGISIEEEAKGLNIRGLGDRYNTTTLNGLPLPSNDAEKKNIDLKMFATDVIEFVTAEKVFTPVLYGDVAGANVDIASKKFRGDKLLELGLNSGSNIDVLKAGQFYLQDGYGMLGFGNTTMPTTTNTYSFQNKWNPEEITVYPNMGFSLKAGHSYQFGKSTLGAFASLSFDNEYKFSEVLKRKVNGSDFIRLDLAGEKYGYETQTTGILNLNLSKGTNQYSLNSILMNTSVQELNNLRGEIFDLAEEGALVRRGEYERNTVWVNQLLGEQTLTKKIKADWGIAFNHVNNIIPDRRHNTLDGPDADFKLLANNDIANNNRYFHDLNENELAANFSLNYQFGKAFEKEATRGKITLGYSGKYKTRNFIATQFNHKIRENQMVSVNDVDSYFNDQNQQAGIFELKTFSSNFVISSTYDGLQNIQAGFLSLEYNFTEKLSALAGVRGEYVFQEIEYNTTLGQGKKHFTELALLPNLSLKYQLTDKTNLRMAASKSYTLPQFKETALFLFEGINEATVGNPFLYPSKNYNGELKWEYFAGQGEAVSLAAFGKYIVDPMNKFVMASASNDFTYANTGGWAELFGLEFDVKKNLFVQSTEQTTRKLNIAANLSLMYTKQELDNTKITTETKGLVTASFNTNTEQLQGAAPVIANASLSYYYAWADMKNSVTSTLVYGYTSDRLNLIGYASLGNQWDKAVHNLDLVFKSKFKRIGINLSAKNILNSKMERIQKNESRDWLVSSWQKGVKLSVGFSYNF